MTTGNSMNLTQSKQRRPRHILKFFGFVLRRFPLAWMVLITTGLLLILEFVTLSLMIPLSTSAGKVASHNSRITDAWVAFAQALGMKPGLLTWVWLFLVTLLLSSILKYGHQTLTAWLSKRIHRRLSERIFSHVVFDEPIVNIYKRSVGHYISLAGDDTFRAGNMVGMAVLTLSGAGSALGGLVMLLLFSHAVFLATVAFLALSALILVGVVKRMLRLNSASVALSREAGTAFLEILNSLRSIRSMGSEAYASDSYARQMLHYTRLLFEVEALRNGLKFLPGILALSTGVIALGPWWRPLGGLSTGVIFGATMILVRLFASLGAMMTSAGNLLLDARATKDLDELTTFGRGRTTGEAPTHRTVDIQDGFDRIRLVAIGFSYLSGSPVLTDLTLEFQAGRTYSIVGPSGTGKSTLADILLGIVEPGSGTMLMGGREVSSRDLRGGVVLVEQQPRIFSASLRENLTLGMETTDQALSEVMHAVDLTHVAGRLPKGLETTLEYQGANLSGGERQRLAIARALLRKPRILILDEATSALDTGTRDRVLKGLKAFMCSGILIFITHDKGVADETDATIEMQRVEQRASQPKDIHVVS